MNRWLKSKWTIGAGVALLLYTAVGFLVLPAVIKSQMLKRLPALTHRNVAVQQVRLNPYALSFTLRGLALTETNGDAFASLGELYVNFELSSIIRRGIAFSQISLKQPSANILYFRDHTFNFSNLISTNAPPRRKSKKKEPLPLVSIGTLEITNGAVAYTDFNHSTPAEYHFGPINIHVNDFTTRPKTGSPYSIAVSSDTGGKFTWSGDISINPPHSAGNFTLTGLQMKRLAAYLRDTAHMELTSGRFELQTDYRFDMAGDTTTFAVSNLTVNLNELAVSNAQMRADLETLRVNVRDVAFDSASNFVRIGALVIDDAAFRFTDQSIQPNVTAGIEKLTGNIKGLTSDLNTAAAVDLKGKVNSRAPFAISGQVNPLPKHLFVDLAILFQDVGLTPISPYMAKYAGYPLEKGALSLDLHYHITHGELKAKNNIRFDQFSLGAANGSADATKMPVKLAVALLQDRHGVIALDVPVTGRLDDPKFKLGPILWQQFMNIIMKAATQPFAMLGSMFGGGEDLDFIAFETGRADFAPNETRKLDTLAHALDERPTLKLVISGSVDPVKDREALARLKLELKLRQLRLQELGQKAGSIDTVVLEPQDRERLLKLTYAETAGLVSANATATSRDTALAHINARQNFEPGRKAAPTGPARPAAGSLTPGDMQKFIVEKTAITQADFAALTQERAAKVQTYLLQTGRVAADRLSVGAPSRDWSRVNLSLQ